MKYQIPYKATFCYILFIVFINMLYLHMPMYTVFGSTFSAADVLVGVIYLVRDFAQREIKHYIFLAMLIAAILSYFLADKNVAIASVSAFVVGELIDWTIFTFTQKPLSKRLIWSALASSPFDSLVFLAISHHLSLVSFIMMTLGKLIGVLVLWGFWISRQRKSEVSASQLL